MDIPILGRSKSKDDLIREQMKMQEMMRTMPALQCPKCGGIYFTQVFMLRVQSDLAPAGGGHKVMPDQTFQCSNIECGFVLGSEEPPTSEDTLEPVGTCDDTPNYGELLPEDDEPFSKPKLNIV